MSTESAPGGDTVAPPTLRSLVGDLAKAQKPPRGVSLYVRWVNRPVGRFIAAVAFRLHLTPNHLTAISAALTYAALVLLAVLPLGTVGIVAVAAVATFAYWLDSADGQLARLLGGGSLLGEWMDHFFDGGKFVLMHFAILATLRREDVASTTTLLWVAGTYLLAVCLLYNGAMLVNELKRRAKPAAASPATEKASGGGSFVWSLLLCGPEHGVLCVLIAFLWAGTAFFAVYCAMAAASVVVALVLFAKWYRDLAHLDRAMDPAAP